MKYTPNLNLKKPEGTESVLISDINENMDVLDAALSEIHQGSASIPNLETTDKELAGAINEVNNKANTNQQQLTAHLEDNMPHQYTNVENNKKYRWGLGQDSGGVYLAREEVI